MAEKAHFEVFGDSERQTNCRISRPVVKDGSTIKVTKIAGARDNLFIVVSLFVMTTRLRRVHVSWVNVCSLQHTLSQSRDAVGRDGSVLFFVPVLRHIGAYLVVERKKRKWAESIRACEMSVLREIGGLSRLARGRNVDIIKADRPLMRDTLNAPWSLTNRQVQWTGNGHSQLPLAKLGKLSPNIDLFRTTGSNGRA